MNVSLEETDSLFVPTYKQGYSLIIGSPHFYVQMKLIATIYERLVKADQLIRENTPREWPEHCANERFDMFVGMYI